MTAPNPSTALARVVIDELLSNGVSLVALSPGSRSAALAIAASQHPEMETVVFLDERSAAFFALGRSKTTGWPTAVLSTSGTAPANWFPAVIEADASCTPLVVVSADRPARLRGVGANQTIDQIELFGSKVRFFADVEAPDHEDRVDSWRRVVRNAVQAASGRTAESLSQPGPAHLNLSFAEPTVPIADDGRSRTERYRHPLDTSQESLPPGTVGRLAGRSATAGVVAGPRGLVIAGDGEYDRDELRAVADALRWPILATALSGMRGKGTLDAYGHRLHVPLEKHQIPDAVIAVGATGPDERLEGLIGAARTRIRVDLWGRHIDPGLHGTTQVTADPVGLIQMLGEGVRPDPEWFESWAEPDRRVRAALEDYLNHDSTPSSARVASAANGVTRGLLVVASSLPIRVVDAHLTTEGQVVANRGASGIDGFVSTALGGSSVRRKTLALAGDLSLFHDSNAWLNDGGYDLTVVVINNGGGALFDFLPQREHAPDFERLFIAPQGRRIADLAMLHGLGHEVVTDMDRLTRVISDSLASGGRNLIEVPVEREDELSTHQTLIQIARSALGGS